LSRLTRFALAPAARLDGALGSRLALRIGPPVGIDAFRVRARLYLARRGRVVGRRRRRLGKLSRGRLDVLARAIAGFLLRRHR
jgi:hypothetical protein